MPTPLEQAKTRTDARCVVLEGTINAYQTKAAAQAAGPNEGRIADELNQLTDAIDELNVRITRRTAELP